MTLSGKLVNNLFQSLNVISDVATGDGAKTVFSLSATPADRNGNNIEQDLDVNVVVDGVVTADANYTVDFTAKTVTLVKAPTTGDPSGNVRISYVTVVYSTDDNTDTVTYGSNQMGIIPEANTAGAVAENEAGVATIQGLLASLTNTEQVTFLTADLWISATSAPTMAVGTTDASGVSVSIAETITIIAKYTFDAKDVIKGTVSITSSAGGTALTPDLTETAVASNKYQVGLVATSDFASHGKPLDRAQHPGQP